MLPKGTKLCIDNALYSSKLSRNLLNFKDIRYNGYHIETNNEGSEEFLYITSIVLGQKLILEKLPIFSSGLYYTTMRIIETNVAIHQKRSDPKVFMLWLDRLGHPGSIIMRRIIENSYEHPFYLVIIHVVPVLKVNSLPNHHIQRLLLSVHLS